MKILNYWDEEKGLNWGINYRSDRTSLIEIAFRVPLLYKRFMKWTNFDTSSLVNGVGALVWNIYFRIRQNLPPQKKIIIESFLSWKVS